MTTQGDRERIPEWTLGDRLRKARQTTGMTVAEFAAQIGVSDRTVNNAEGDKRTVRPITLNAWALATGVSIDWLTTGQGTSGPVPPRDGPHGDASALARLTDRKRRKAPTSHTGALNADKRGYGVAA